MTDQILKVEGMSCDHCVQTITEKVGGLSGVKKVSVDLDKKEVAVSFDESLTPANEISTQIKDAGFEVL